MATRSGIRNLFARPVARAIRKAPTAPRLRVEPPGDRCLIDATVTGTAAADLFRVRPGAAAGTVVVASDNDTFKPTTLTNPTGTLTLPTGAGDDTITIEPLGSAFTGDVTVIDPDGVMLRDIDLSGNLMVNAVRAKETVPGTQNGTSFVPERCRCASKRIWGLSWRTIRAIPSVSPSGSARATARR